MMWVFCFQFCFFDFFIVFISSYSIGSIKEYLFINREIDKNIMIFVR